MLAHVLLYDYDYIAYFSHQNNSLKERSIFFIDLEQLFVVFCSQKLLLLNPRTSRRGGGGVKWNPHRFFEPFKQSK